MQSDPDIDAVIPSTLSAVNGYGLFSKEKGSAPNPQSFPP
jgi:hypothetical protein